MRPVIVYLLLHGVLLCGTFSGLLPCFLSGFLTFHVALRIHMDTRDFTGFRSKSLLATSFATSHTAWSWKPDCGGRGNEKTMTQKKGQTHKQTNWNWVGCVYSSGGHLLQRPKTPTIFFYVQHQKQTLSSLGRRNLSRRGISCCSLRKLRLPLCAHMSRRKALQFLQASQGKALLIPWVWGIGVLDIVITMSIHVLVGLHLLSTIFR